MSIRRASLAVLIVVTGLLAPLPARQPAPVSPSLFAGLQWRGIGPHRASRTVAAAGHRGQPHTFYMAPVNGGVWKTTDAGRTWTPIFDDQPTGSIGAARRRPVGSERGLRGQRRRTAPPRPLHGQRRLQVGRRREDVDAHRPARRAADPAHRRRSAQRRPRVRRGARPPVRPERRARHLPVDRRRPHVPEGALQGREHRRQRRGHRSVQPRHGLRDAVGRAAGAVGERGVGGHAAAASSSPPTAARRGSRSRTVFPPSSRRTWPSRCPTRSASTRPWRISTSRASARTAARPASSGATTRARRGRASPPTRGPPAGSAAATSRCRCPTRRTPIASSWRARCRGSRTTAGRRGSRSRARRAARTTRTAGSTRTIPTSCCSPWTRAPS